jgi:hypothetical protein
VTTISGADGQPIVTLAGERVEVDYGIFKPEEAV